MHFIHQNSCHICKSQNISLFMKCKDFSITKEDFDLCTCDDCGFVFTQNIPTEQNISTYYEFDEYISHTDTKKGFVNKIYHFSRSFMLAKKRKTIEKIYNRQEKELLDIGSGTGYFLNHMKKNSWNVIGVEQDKEAREFSKQNFDLEVHPPDGLFNLPEKRFAIITMWHVLEHVHTLEKYLLKIYDLLKDDGFLFIAVPNYTSFDAKYYKLFWAAFDVPRHLWHFSPATFNRLMKRFNFKVLTKKRMPLDAFYVSLLSERHKQSGKLLLLFRGFCIGLMSYLKSLINVDSSSSIIYVLQKKNTH